MSRELVIAESRASRTEASDTDQSPSEETQSKECILCGSILEITLTRVVDNRFGAPGEYEIRRCVRCGFEQTFPTPCIQDLKLLYERYYNFGEQQSSLYSRLRERFLFSWLNRVWIWLDGDVAFHRQHGTGRLLDVGCNEGRSLRIFEHNGFRSEGLELNATAAATARRAGFVVYTRLLGDFEPVDPYDVAVLSNVLEHSLCPQKMLEDIRRILGGRGQVWISCPNSSSWLRKIFGRAWINWHVPFHISHFNPQTLQKLVRDSGYKEVTLRHITPALWVAQSFIAYLFAKKGQKTSQLRNPFLTAFFMMLARFLLFPALWLGNRLGRGDCLVVTAMRGDSPSASHLGG